MSWRGAGTIGCSNRWGFVAALVLVLGLGVGCEDRSEHGDQAAESEEKLVGADDAVQIPEMQPVTGSAGPSGTGFLVRGDAVSREFRTLTKAEEARLQELVQEFWRTPLERDNILELMENHFYGESILSFAQQLIESGDSDLIESAVALVDGNVSGKVLPLLDQCLEHPDAALRLVAVEAAMQVRSAKIASFLERVFQDDNPDVRLSFFDNMEHHTATQKLRINEVGLQAPFDDVRMTSVAELELMSTPAALELLIKALDSEFEDLRVETAESIEFLVGENFSSAAEALRWWQKNRRRFDSDLVEVD
jgi:hypothetical protein